MPEYEIDIEISEIKGVKAWFERPKQGGLKGKFYKEILKLEFNGYKAELHELITFSTPDWLQFNIIRAPA